jgi:hypothetical protein
VDGAARLSDHHARASEDGGRRKQAGDVVVLSVPWRKDRDHGDGDRSSAGD